MCPFCVTGHVRSNSERKREEKKNGKKKKTVWVQEIDGRRQERGKREWDVKEDENTEIGRVIRLCNAFISFIRKLWSNLFFSGFSLSYDLNAFERGNKVDHLSSGISLYLSAVWSSELRGFLFCLFLVPLMCFLYRKQTKRYLITLIGSWPVLWCLPLSLPCTVINLFSTLAVADD